MLSSVGRKHYAWFHYSVNKHDKEAMVSLQFCNIHDGTPWVYETKQATQIGLDRRQTYYQTGKGKIRHYILRSINLTPLPLCYALLAVDLRLQVVNHCTSKNQSVYEICKPN